MSYTASTKKDSINIYVINNTGTPYTGPSYWRHHGKTINPAVDIPGDSTQTLIASYGKDSGYGPLGTLTYGLESNVQMIIYWNNPESGEGKLTLSKAESYCQWLYVFLQPPDGQSTNYYVDVTNFEPDWYDGTVMNPVITINELK